MTARDPRPKRTPAGRGSAGRRGPRVDPPPHHPEAWGAETRPLVKSLTMQTLRGVAVSPGVAIGPPLVIDPSGHRLPHRAIPAEAVPAELERLEHGLALAKGEAEAAEAEARERIGPQYADILAAHAQIISDPTLRRDARALPERRDRDDRGGFRGRAPEPYACGPWGHALGGGW